VSASGSSARLVMIPAPEGARVETINPSCASCGKPLPLQWWAEVTRGGRSIKYPTLAASVVSGSHETHGRAAHAECIAELEKRPR
jgi:hypothetical protein